MEGLVNYLNKAVRAAAEPTTSYVAGTVIDDCENFNQLDVLVQYTKASSTSAEIKVEFSVDGSVYFREANATASSGTTTLVLNEYTFGASGNYRIEIPISCRYVKISAKVTGTEAASSITVDAVLHTV